MIVPAEEAVYVFTLRITQDDDEQCPVTVRIPPEYECDEGWELQMELSQELNSSSHAFARGVNNAKKRRRRAMRENPNL